MVSEIVPRRETQNTPEIPMGLTPYRKKLIRRLGSGNEKQKNNVLPGPPSNRCIGAAELLHKHGLLLRGRRLRDLRSSSAELLGNQLLLQQSVLCGTGDTRPEDTPTVVEPTRADIIITAATSTVVRIVSSRPEPEHAPCHHHVRQEAVAMWFTTRFPPTIRAHSITITIATIQEDDTKPAASRARVEPIQVAIITMASIFMVERTDNITLRARGLSKVEINTTVKEELPARIVRDIEPRS